MQRKQNEYKEALRQKKELFKLILKKTGLTQDDVLLPIIQQFINENMNIVTKTELKKFDKLIFQ